MRKAPPSPELRRVRVNGQPGLMAALGGRVVNVLTFGVIDGRITTCYVIRNPEKLARAGEVWQPAFARFVGAPPPPRVTEEQAHAAAGEDAVYYYTKHRGASNEKAKRTFGFKPRRLEWLDR
jgi:hypothetical protein